MPLQLEPGNSTVGSVEASREAAQNQVNALRQRYQQSWRAATHLPAPRRGGWVYSQLQKLEQSTTPVAGSQNANSTPATRTKVLSPINQQTIGLLQEN